MRQRAVPRARMVCRHFNPLIPNGMRPPGRSHSSTTSEFQSTHPKRDETFEPSNIFLPTRHFNPLIPNGMRRSMSYPLPLCVHFNPLIPNGMRPFRSLWSNRTCNFNPLIPNGMRPLVIVSSANCFNDFNPLIPNGMRP